MKSIDSFPEYWALPDGRIWSGKSGKCLKPSDNGNGYKHLVLRRDGKSYKRYVHRLVAEAYFGKSDLEVNHKDGDKSNNRPDNLEYVTSSENTIHGFANGLMHTVPIQMVKNGVALYFPTQVLAAKQLGVSKAAINSLIKGRNKTVKGYSLA